MGGGQTPKGYLPSRVVTEREAQEGDRGGLVVREGTPGEEQISEGKGKTNFFSVSFPLSIIEYFLLY